MARIFSYSASAGRIAVFATLFGVMTCGLPACRDHEVIFSRNSLLSASALDLKSTIITPHLETRITPGRNLLWCGTFQLAWNECCKLIGQDVHFAQDPPMVAFLNRKAFTRADLDEDSYVALAGFVRDGIDARIRRALAKKFKGRARPKLLPDMRLTPRPQDIVAYAYLFKHLQFATPFEKVREPLDFKGTKLPAFGMGPEYKTEHHRMYPQVSVLDYTSPDDFIIELKSNATSDRIILAKLTPSATLAATIAAVTRRINSAEPTDAATGDILMVPKLNFDLTRGYRELTGRLLVTTNPKVAKDLLLLRADQNIRFQMDEKGVRLRSEAVMQFAGSAGERPRPEHIMIFDKPFLIMLERIESKSPYFALWVQNAELLVH